MGCTVACSFVNTVGQQGGEGEGQGGSGEVGFGGTSTLLIDKNTKGCCKGEKQGRPVIREIRLLDTNT